MALTVSGLDFSVAGDKRRTIATGTADTSYPTGGYSLLPSQLGMGTILLLDCNFDANSTPAIRAVQYNNATNKLRFFGENFAEIANATDLSAFSGQLEVVGW